MSLVRESVLNRSPQGIQWLLAFVTVNTPASAIVSRRLLCLVTNMTGPYTYHASATDTRPSMSNGYWEDGVYEYYLQLSGNALHQLLMWRFTFWDRPERGSTHTRVYMKRREDRGVA